MGIIVGCDLGTTNSVVCFRDKLGKSIFIKDESGSVLIPSVVCHGDKYYVGTEAVENEENFPQETIRSSKRYIGDASSPIDATSVASKILAYLKSITESQLKETVDGIVITVPAYFNQNQRLETKKAAESAGLNVLRIINEPTAAALAYGEEAKLNELVLVYDLGGGTFDVTLLELSEDNVYQVLSTSGDTKLGGDDFDNLLADYISSPIPHHVKTFKDFDVRLKKFAEEIKIQLNYKTQVTKTLKYCGLLDGKLYHHKVDITKETYEWMIQNLLIKTKSHVLNALNDADRKISQLSKIILVGGSTKSKFVRDYVSKNFNTKIYSDIDPDLTVAAGAASLAHTISEKTEDSALLIDVTPLSLGIETKGGLLNKIIPRNANIPVSSAQDFITAEDNQESVNIRIYQGERPLAKDNEFLGEFVLSGFEKRPKGQTKIVVKFDIDSSGLITVSAFDKISGIQSEVTLKPLTSDDVNKLLDDIEVNHQDDKALMQKIEMDQLIQDARTLMLSRKIISGDNELEETFESVKDDVVALKVFIQSIKDA
jgi:molecular chaperone DnaK